MTLEQVIELAKQAGFKASVGKTDKEGNYHPDKNALSKDVPIEWLERFAALVRDQYRAELLVGTDPDDILNDALYYADTRIMAIKGRAKAGEVESAWRDLKQSVSDQQAAAVLRARNQALEDAAHKCQQLEVAIDGGGNAYYRPADARQCAAAIRNMKDNT